MTVETDRFVVASFALWSGDLAYAGSLLTEIRRERETFLSVESIEEPEEIVRLAAALRLRQLAQKRGEFRKLSEDLRDRGLSISDAATIIQTSHLRGTVWRTELRRFLMQAYLTSLRWESEFFERVHALAEPTADIDMPPADDIGLNLAGEPIKVIGGTWAITGNPFVEVTVTDMGLLEAEAIWTGSRPPQEFEPIRQAFQRLLEDLDDGGSQGTRRR